MSREVLPEWKTKGILGFCPVTVAMLGLSRVSDSSMDPQTFWASQAERAPAFYPLNRGVSFQMRRTTSLTSIQMPQLNCTRSITS